MLFVQMVWLFGQDDFQCWLYQIVLQMFGYCVVVMFVQYGVDMQCGCVFVIQCDIVGQGCDFGLFFDWDWFIGFVVLVEKCQCCGLKCVNGFEVGGVQLFGFCKGYQVCYYFIVFFQNDGIGLFGVVVQQFCFYCMFFWGNEKWFDVLWILLGVLGWLCGISQWVMGLMLLFVFSFVIYFLLLVVWLFCLVWWLFVLWFLLLVLGGLVLCSCCGFLMLCKLFSFLCCVCCLVLKFLLVFLGLNFWFIWCFFLGCYCFVGVCFLFCWVGVLMLVGFFCCLLVCQNCCKMKIVMIIVMMMVMMMIVFWFV